MSIKTSKISRVIEITEGLGCIVNSGFSSNTYVVEYSSGLAFIVDPGLDPESIDIYLQKKSLRPTHIFCTHGHFDHLGSVTFFQEKYDSITHLHENDKKVSKSANFLMMACKVPGKIEVPQFHFYMNKENYSVPLENERLSYFHSPGHTQGSCCLSFEKCLFTGDTLYAHAVGLVSLPGEDKKQLAQSIDKIFNSFAGDFLVLPGHGPAVTLAEVQKNNKPLQDFLQDHLQVEATVY